MPTVLYCDSCETQKLMAPVTVQRGIRAARLDEPWGDVECRVCGHIILTFRASEPGTYALTKVANVGWDRTDAEEHWFYCETCQAVRLLGIDDVAADPEVPEQGIWGDMICLTCHSVITTVKADEPGVYAFVKVDERPKEMLEGKPHDATTL